MLINLTFVKYIECFWVSSLWWLISPGYCGADVKALCTEASLAALRRRYPQIYSSSQRYKLDVGSIVLGPQDFRHALRSIVPAAQRALAPPGRALSCTLQPLLERSLTHTLNCLFRVFPHAELPHREQTHGTEWITAWGSAVLDLLKLSYWIEYCNL